MITPDEAIRIANLRERLFRCIEDELNRDGHHKSYEGAIDITMSLPSIFKRGDSVVWTIEWHCYVVPETGRHIAWQGKTLSCALAVAEAEVEKLAFPYEMERFDRDMSLLEDEPGEADGSRKIYANSRNTKHREE